ncbi:MAG: glutamate 5-kinase, partial [Pseudomonadota bacterium]
MIKINNAKRLVVKVGSSILINAKSQINGEWLAAFAQDVSALIAGGTQVIIVTSGAVALGKQALAIKSQRLKLEEKQAAAACGQIMLMQAWRESLLGHNIAAAQILLTIDDSENRRRYLNARSTLETLLSNNIIPIINENDTVATA